MKSCKCSDKGSTPATAREAAISARYCKKVVEARAMKEVLPWEGRLAWLAEGLKAHAW